MKKIVLIFTILTLLAGGTGLGFYWGQQMPRRIIISDAINRESALAPANFNTFWEAWQKLNNNYLKDEDISPENKTYGAIRGLVGALNDPYSQFFSPEDTKKFQEDVQGNFGGIGAELGMRQNKLLVIAPLKNTPAERAGLKAGDQILQVNSSSTEGVQIDEAVGWIRGPQGTRVKLLMYRDSWEKPKEIEITRGLIRIPTLDWEMKGEVAYIQLYSFNANAENLFYDAVLKMSEAKNVRGIVLDLRNNPGGYLQTAVNLAGWFLPRNTLVVSEVGREGGGASRMRAMGNEALAGIPTVVLINGGSASASEILAGALRDQRKIKLVGEKSFGKGTVQELFDLSDDSSLKITIAHWVLPSGKILEEGGLVPDVEVELKEEDVQAKKDPQLDKALELVGQEISK